MKDSCYIVLNKSGIVRMVKTKMPKLGANERVVKVELVVDDRAFQPPPVMKTTIAVGVEHVGVPTVTAEPAVLSTAAEKYEPEIETDGTYYIGKENDGVPIGRGAPPIGMD